MTFAKYSESALAQDFEATRLAEIMETPHDAPPKVLFMLTVYLDESGQETKDFVVIAGFVGTENQWESFIPEWRKGLGKRQSLHVRELYWNEPRTEQLLARLGPIPYRHGLTPVIGGVRVSDYLDLLDNPVEQLMISGYACALHPILIHVMMASGSERVKWVFEEQPYYEPVARSIFKMCDVYGAKARLAGLEFVPKSSTMLTQPADYLAYATIQHLRDPDSKKAKWCSPIRGDGKSLGLIPDREQIRTIVRFVTSAAAAETLLDTGKTVRELTADYATAGGIRNVISRTRSKN